MLDVSLLFHEVEDPRRSNATRHDLQEMLLIALLSVLSSGEGCVDMEHFGRAKEGFLRQFLRLERGIPSHDALTSSWTWLAPPCSLSKFQMRLPWEPRPWCRPERHAGNPWSFDHQLYARRNEVERLFGRLKRYRRVGTRYDKLDVMFAGFIYLALIYEMIRNLV